MSVAFDQSQTRLNLMRAFAGESQARNRYTFAAGLARKKNLYVLESVFTFTADQEKAHAKVFYNLLEQVSGQSLQVDGTYPVELFPDILDHLRSAQHNEYQEYSHDYAGFAKTAREEGFPEIAHIFTMIAGIEKIHGDRFGQFAQLMEQDRLFVSDACAGIPRGSSSAWRWPPSSKLPKQKVRPPRGRPDFLLGLTGQENPSIIRMLIIRKLIDGGHPMESLHYLLMKAHTTLNRKIVAGVGKLGLTSGQPKVLDYLNRFGERDQKTIAAYCEIEPATVGSILTRMEAEGLILRRQRPGNRRSLYVSLTERGREAAAALDGVFAAAEEEATRAMSPDEVEALRAALERFCRSAGREV